jgi:hypothetical protein
VVRTRYGPGRCHGGTNPARESAGESREMRQAAMPASPGGTQTSLGTKACATASG